MMKEFSRRTFVRNSALAAAASVAMPRFASAGVQPIKLGHPSPIRLGLASYTFRNFTRAQLIGFMKELNITQLNAKDVKNHLPMDPQVKLRRWPTTRLRASKSTLRALCRSPKTTMTTFAPSLNMPSAPGSKCWSPVIPRQRRCRASKNSSGNTTSASPSTITGRKTSSGRGRCRFTRPSRRWTRAWVAALTWGTRHAPAPTFRRRFARLAHAFSTCICKDLTDFSAKESQVAVGEGYLPIADIFLALAYNHYPGWVDLEYEIKPERSAARRRRELYLYARRDRRDGLQLARDTEAVEAAQSGRSVVAARVGNSC